MERERDEQMLTDRDVAGLLKVSRKTLERMVEEEPDFPKPIKVRRQDRWTLGDIRQWQMLEKLKRKAAASVGPVPDKLGQSQTSAQGTTNPSSEPKRKV